MAVINFSVYLGSEEENCRIQSWLHCSHRYDENVVKQEPPCVFDNFFSIPRLLEHLELQDTYLCSMVQCNRKDFPPCAKNKFPNSRGLVQTQNGNMFTK